MRSRARSDASAKQAGAAACRSFSDDCFGGCYPVGASLSSRAWTGEHRPSHLSRSGPQAAAWGSAHSPVGFSAQLPFVSRAGVAGTMCAARPR